MSQTSSIPAYTLFGEDMPFPDVVHCEDFSARAPMHHWKIHPHRHSQMSQLFVILRGSVQASADQERWHLSNGMALYVPENCVHGFDFEPATEGAVFSFPTNVVQSVGPTGPDFSARLKAPFSMAVDETLRDLCQMLSRIAQDPSLFRAQKAVGLAHAVLAFVAEANGDVAQSARDSVSDRLKPLDGLIADHSSEGWSASDYANALSMSTGHLSRLCRQASGLGAAAYIEGKVMSEACRLLAFTQLPISEVGYRLGYADPSYFSKRFNASQGCAPSAYRAQFVT